MIAATGSSKFSVRLRGGGGGASKSVAPSPDSGGAAADPALHKRIHDALPGLSYDRKNAFDGQLVPPRPSAQEQAAGKTPTGPLFVEGGVVIQGGAFGATWLRVGCVRQREVAWPALCTLLEACTQAQLAKEDSKERPGPVYLAISNSAMQSVDFIWLAANSFSFHHHRPPAHGHADADPSTAELVYYRWPSTLHRDMVPSFATSIEGVTGLVFSQDGEKMLVVWERKAWCTPGGAVDSGESKLDTLEREVMEEVQLKLDRSWEGMRYLGGWQQQCARDNRINDNFSVFACRCVDEQFKVDGVEIKEAHWMPWRKILAAWRDLGCPSDQKRVVIADFASVVGMPQLAAEQNVVLLNVLQWLSTFEEGKGFEMTSDAWTQGPKQVTKLKWAATLK